MGEKHRRLKLRTDGHNKTGNAYRIAKKFAAYMPCIIGSSRSKFGGDNWFIFKEVTTK